MIIYVIIEANGYDGFNEPHNYVYYTDKDIAQKECDKLNKAAGAIRDYFDVCELDPYKI